MRIRPHAILLVAILVVPSLAIVGAAPTQAATPLDPCGGIPGEPNPNAGCQLALGRGVNLAVWLQYNVAPGWWTTKEDLQRIKALGFDHVRIPIDPLLYMKWNDGTFRTFDEPNARKLDIALDWVRDAGLTAIVDLHPYEWYTRAIITEPKVRAEYSNLLTGLARHLDHRYETVALGLLNEPSDPDGDPNTPFDYNPVQLQLWSAARAGSARLTLVATGDDWSSVDGLKRVDPLPDQNVVYDFHFYTPFLFTHQGAWWTWHIVKPIHSLPYPSNPENVAAVRGAILSGIPEQWLRDDVGRFLTWYGQDRWDRAKLAARFDEVQSWAAQNGTRVILGEFGVYERNALDADRVRWTRDVRELAEERGMPWTLWDHDSDFGLVDRDTKTVHAGLAGALGLRV